jgi:hypothetical protein
LGQVGGGGITRFIGGDVQVSLIERERFDQVAILKEDVADVLGNLSVMIKLDSRKFSVLGLASIGCNRWY